MVDEIALRELDVLELGTGRPVLLLHGTPCPPAHLLPLARALAQEFRVLLPALPGYGRTPPARPPGILAQGNRLVEAAALARGIDEAMVVGYSLGGYRALELALGGSLRVRAIAALGSFAHLEPEDRGAKAELAAALRAGADLRDAVVGLALTPATAAAHPALVEDVRGWLSATSAGNLAAEMDEVAACADLRPRLAGLRIPVLSRIGSADPACPVRLARALATCTGGRLELVPDVAHAILHEDLEGTTRSIQAFLRSVP